MLFGFFAPEKVLANPNEIISFTVVQDGVVDQPFMYVTSTTNNTSTSQNIEYVLAVDNTIETQLEFPYIAFTSRSGGVCKVSGGSLTRSIAYDYTHEVVSGEYIVDAWATATVTCIFKGIKPLRKAMIITTTSTEGTASKAFLLRVWGKTFLPRLLSYSTTDPWGSVAHLGVLITTNFFFAVGYTSSISITHFQYIYPAI